MLKVIGGEQEGEFKAVASGTLPNGKPVVVNSDGTVSVVASSSVSETLGSATPIDSDPNKFDVVASYDSTNSKVVVFYRDGNNSNYGTAVVGTVSGTSISWGTPAVFNSETTETRAATFDSGQGSHLIIYNDPSNRGAANVIQVSGNSISSGTKVLFKNGTALKMSCAYDSVNGKALVCYRDSGNSKGASHVGTISGTSITFTGPYNFYNSTATETAVTYDITSGNMLVFYKDASNTMYGIVGTISGTAISYGTAVNWSSNNCFYLSAAYDSSANKHILCFQDNGVSGNPGRYVIATVSGTTVSFGTVTTFTGSNTIYQNSVAYNPEANKITVFYRDGTNNNYGTYITGVISGTSVTFETAVVWLNQYVFNVSAVYDSSNKVLVTGYRNVTTNTDSGAIVLQNAYTSTNITAENYIGISKGYTDRASQSVGSATVFESASTLFTAATYDANAQKVVIAYADGGNSNYGTAVVGTVSGTSISFGTPVVFESAGVDVPFATYDSNAQKVVIAYQDQGNSSRGTAIVGTVSGTSISFGTAAVFETGSVNYISATYDSNAQKIVISYMDGGSSDHGNAVVGTVSGTSISFGTPVTFNSSTTDYTSITYDSNTQKVVIAYRDGGSFPTYYGKAIVGTVSGTSISFGTAVTFITGSTIYHSATYDTNAQKVVIAYRDGTNSNYGTAIVGTVSGTSISFGTAVVFDNTNSFYISATFDSSVNKIVIAYRDVNNSSYGTLVAGTVSGTSISFGTPVVFEAASSYYQSATYDSAAQKVVVAYRDLGNSNYGTAVVFQNAYDNSGSVADGDPARTDIIGSVSTNQTGLTAGEKYYVQTDGTLSTTADDPSVLAGTAISATKLVVKT